MKDRSKMMVGLRGRDFVYKESGVVSDKYNLVFNHKMCCCMSQEDDTELDVVFGYNVPNVSTDGITEEWLADIQHKADMFKDLTGSVPKLMGVEVCLIYIRLGRSDVT